MLNFKLHQLLSSKLFIIAIIAIYMVIIYPILQSGFFIWDDKEFLSNEIITLSSCWEIFYKPQYGLYHPVTTGYLKLNFLLHQNDPVILHIENVILHIVNGFLVYQILRRLGFTGILGFVIYLFHPLTAEVAFWITSIKDLLFCLFAFLSILLYIGFLGDPSKKRSYLLSILFVILALLSKIQAIFLPLVLMALDYYYKRKIISIRTITLVFLGLIAIGLVILNLYFRILVSDLGSLPSFDMFTKFVITSRNFTEYFVATIFPVKFSVFYPFDFKNSLSVFSLSTLYLLFPIIYLLGVILAWRKGNYKLALILVIYALSLMPVLQFFQIGESMRNDRYAYFSLFALAFFIEYIFRTIKSPFVNWRTLKILITSYIFMLVVLLIFRVPLWSEPRKLFIHSYNEYPQSEILANTLGVLYLRENNQEMALQCLNSAIALAPDYAQAFYNRGLLFEKYKNIPNAISSFKQALSKNQNYTDAAFRLGQLYFINDATDEARIVLIGLGQQYYNAPLYDLMGKIEYSGGNNKKSIYYAKAAIKLDPSNEIYLYNYALSLGSNGDLSEALMILNRCIDLDPSFHEAYYLRGIVKIKNSSNGCDDLNKAKTLGNLMAEAAIKALCH